MLWDLEKNLSDLKFFGKLLIDDNETNVSIEYEPPKKMRILGLSQLPTLSFEGDEIRSSMDDKKSTILEDNDYLVFRLLDPRQIAQWLIKSGEFREETQFISGHYSMDLLNLKSYDVFSKRNESIRSVKFELDKRNLPKRMIQKDLPGFESTAVVEFSYEKG